MEFLLSIFKCLSNEGLVGLQSIQYIFFLSFILFEYPELIKNQNNTFIDILSNKLNDIYSSNSIIVDFDINKITTKICNLIDLSDFNNIKKSTLLNDIFNLHLDNENLAVIKDYVKYYNKKILSEWILEIGNPKICDSSELIYVGNIKINSCIDILIDKYNQNNNGNIILNKIYGNQQNTLIKSLVTLNMLLNSKQNFTKNINSNDLLFKDIGLDIQTFDLIYFDFPTGIHNIIHASCCNKIKKLKLRGTKSEPLLLQLIMCSLNKNGRAVLVVPDSLLFSDSIQPIETRKYLIENFNVKKIVQIDESLYVGKSNKNSVLYFENNGPTKIVEFSKLILNTNNINMLEELNLSNISVDIIKSNVFSLYHKNYESLNIIKDNIKSVSFNDIFEIKTNNDLLPNSQFICLEKYYKNNKSIEIRTQKQNNFDYYIVMKNQDNFNIKLLENIIRTKYLNLVKGKMNQFDLVKVSQIEIPIVSETIKKSVCEYIDITNKIILDNNNKIESTLQLKSCFINSICLDNMISIDKIGYLYDKKNNHNDILINNTIGVIRNGLSAGQVYIMNNNNIISLNSHYIKITDTNYSVDFVYQYLKHCENKLKELANLNPQPNLSQNNLLNFKIPILSLDNQTEIVTHCNDFDSVISKYKSNNNALMEKDIINTILKINTFIL
jgi:hypothetical protein